MIRQGAGGIIDIEVVASPRVKAGEVRVAELVIADAAMTAGCNVVSTT